MNQPLVSIVTPSFNQAQFLEETIRSVLEQEYPRIEYIICDGGSTDGSADIIRRYADRLAWWCSERDAGQSDAINKGWRRASGQVWAYLNSDDVLLPGAVRAVVAAFQAHPGAGIVHGDWIWIDAAGAEQGAGHGAPTDFRKLLRDGQIQYVAQAASFYRSAIVRQVGLIDPGLHLSMDYDLLLRLARVAAAVYVPQPLARVRLHATAKTSALTERHWQESLAVRARYGGRYLLKPRLGYWRYRTLRALPAPVQAAFRRWRNSPNDWVWLGVNREGK
ncbi:MAG TPA: glycosyltransferase family 2 protein [Candidatus Margulisiibacteriota bacterium]|nr:glycosyltransferase family 2 protein [Candidatus Margulisiibacteriota bacterium]